MPDWELYLYSPQNLIARQSVDNEIKDEFLMSMDFHCNQRQRQSEKYTVLISLEGILISVHINL